MKKRFCRVLPALLAAVLLNGSAIAGDSMAEYFPLRAGTYWAYDGKMSNGRSAKVTTVAREGPTMGDTKTIFLDEDETQFFPGLHNYWYFAATPSGVQLYRYETPYSGDCKPFAPAVNYLPSAAKPGSTFAQVHSLNCRAASMLLSRTLRVRNKEKVTVPLGTFDALRVEEDIAYSIPAARGSNTEHHVVWLVAGIGEVKRLWQRRDASGNTTSGEFALADTNANRPAAASKAEQDGIATAMSRLSMGHIAVAPVRD